MKKYRTRKEKTLRRICLIAVLLAALTVTNAINLLPRQAAMDIAEMQNMEEAELLRSFYNGKLKAYRFARQLLLEDEHALLLCAVAWDPLAGWYDRDWCTLPTTGDEPVYAGIRSHMQGGKCVTYVFGRVEDERVAKVEFVYGTAEDGGGDAVLWELPQEAYFREGGERYFLMETDAFLEEEGRGFRSATVVSRDGDGSVLSESDVWAQHWGSSE